MSYTCPPKCQNPEIPAPGSGQGERNGKRCEIQIYYFRNSARMQYKKKRGQECQDPAPLCGKQKAPVIARSPGKAAKGDSKMKAPGIRSRPRGGELLN